MTADNAFISIQDVGKTYGTFRAIENVSMDARGVNHIDGHVNLDVDGIGPLNVREEGAMMSEAERICIAICPENLFFLDIAPNGPENAISGVIELIKYLCERSHYYIQAPGCADLISNSAQNIRMNKPNSAKEGLPVWMTRTPDALIVLER